MTNKIEAEATKRCNHCKAELPLSQFKRTTCKTSRDGYWPACITCKRAQSKAWRETNWGKWLASETIRRHKNPERQRENTRRHRAKLSQEEKSARNRKWDLKKNFGITVEDYEFIFSKQNGGCGICGLLCATGRRLAVDHNHETGKIRGLLCSACNLAVGKIEAIPNWTQKAAFYLAQHCEEELGMGSEVAHYGEKELRHLRS